MLEDYKKYQNEAHAFMDLENYVEASTKFNLASKQQVAPNLQANSLNNAGIMLYLGGKDFLAVNDLLDQALKILKDEDPLDKTTALVTTRINRLKDQMTKEG